MKPGRPKLNQQVKVIQVKVRLYEGSDDDLIAFFSHIPPGLRAAMVKRALRSGTYAGVGAVDSDDQSLSILDSLVS